MIELVFKLLSSGLSLWETKEKNKYVDKMLQLKKDYYAEINKPENLRNNAALDNIEFELSILCESFAATSNRK